MPRSTGRLLGLSTGRALARATRAPPRRPAATLPVLLAAGRRLSCGAPRPSPPSPQASAEPAPLANVPAATTSVTDDGGPPPEPLRSDRPLPPDSPHEATREPGPKETARDTKELAGYALQAVLRTGEGPAAAKGPETTFSAIEAAKRKTETRITIEASQARARFVLSAGFVLPQGTELRARADRYGHLVLWPGEETYRVAESGSLRALLGERRLDVAPISQAAVTPVADGGRRLNLRTRRLEVWTRAARASFELASFRDAGEGGVLVCRLLLDLMNAPPSTAVCASDEVPLHAELRWTTKGALTFDVTSIARRADLSAQDLAAPPAQATFETRPPAQIGGEALLSKADLASFRSAPVDPGPMGTRDAQPPPPESGLQVVNSSDELRVVWLDGVPVAWVAPGGGQWLSSLMRGRYVLQWRTFLGDAWEPPRNVGAPGWADVNVL